MSQGAGPLQVVAWILAALFAFGSATAIMQGDLKSSLMPVWIDFAIAHPTLFAFVLVGGTLLIGAPFVAAAGNY